jgi:hypothetical protein
LFWFLRARVREQAELACDAWALECAPAARLGYARALVEALRTAHPAPALPVLAARPGARRAFERRLAMILQQSVPCRFSRWSLIGVAALGLASAVTPVAAQERGERPRVEIRVDGVPVEQLDASRRERLLRSLGLEGEALRLALQARAMETATEPEPETAPPRRARRDAPERVRPVREPEPRPGARGLLREALAEARDELRRDPDLQELGITDSVVGLVDALGEGRDFGSALDRLIGDAVASAGRLAQREIAAEPELQRLGIADDVGRLVTGLLENGEIQQGLGVIARKAMHHALGEVRTELKGDPDLKALGIDDELDGLLEGLQAGRFDLDALEPLIDQAVRGALRAAGDAVEAAPVERNPRRPSRR